APRVTRPPPSTRPPARRGGWRRSMTGGARRRRCSPSSKRARPPPKIPPMPDAGQVREEQRDPQEEARRLAALAQVRQYPDPVLRMETPEVEEFDDDLARLVERMK